MFDWRKGSSSLSDLVSQFYNREEELEYTDVTFNLPDGSQVQAHKFVLAMASPFFEAQFYGLLAVENQVIFNIHDVDSKSFRRLLDFIYNSRALDWEMERMDFWDLLEVANMYLIPELIEHCKKKLEAIIEYNNDAYNVEKEMHYYSNPSNFEEIRNPSNMDDKVRNLNKASQFWHSKDIYQMGLDAIKRFSFKALLKQNTWGKVNLNVVIDILEDTDLNVKEGDLFSALVDWCKVNTSSETESVELFRNKFLDKIIVQNISLSALTGIVEPSNYLSPQVFENWKCQVMNNGTQEGTRVTLKPVKVAQITSDNLNFRNPEKANNLVDSTGGFRCGSGSFSSYTDVNVHYGVVLSSNKKLLQLVTTHKPRKPFTTDAITERVTVKLVAKNHDGNIITELNKVIEDQELTKSTQFGLAKSKYFELSKSPSERKNWHWIECVVALDRRPKCTIRGISEADYATSVCTSSSNAHIDKAMSFEFKTTTSIDDAIETIATAVSRNDHSSLDPKEKYTANVIELNLRSWALRDWTPEMLRHWTPQIWCSLKNMGDFMRLRTQQDFHSKDNALVITDKIESDVQYNENTKKTLFVCSYNPQSNQVEYLRTISVDVFTETKDVASDATKAMDLGVIDVNQHFLNQIFDKSFTDAEKPPKMYIRRVFADKDECDPEVQKLLVDEILKNQRLTHVDNKHVIVIQENVPGIDYDQFILKKFREIKVVFKPRHNEGSHFVSSLDSESRVKDVIETLSRLSGVPGSDIKIFECYSGRSMEPRPADFPIHTKTNVKLKQMFNNCKENTRIIYYE